MRAFFDAVDRLILAIYPLMIGSLLIAICCGFVLALLGLGRLTGLIDLGAFLPGLGPGWIIGGGLGIALGAVGGILRFQELRLEVLGRRLDRLEGED